MATSELGPAVPSWYQDSARGWVANSEADPVSVMGRTVGVIHVVSDATAPLDDGIIQGPTCSPITLGAGWACYG